MRTHRHLNSLFSDIHLLILSFLPIEFIYQNFLEPRDASQAQRQFTEEWRRKFARWIQSGIFFRIREKPAFVEVIYEPNTSTEFVSLNDHPHNGYPQLFHDLAELYRHVHSAVSQQSQPSARSFMRRLWDTSLAGYSTRTQYGRLAHSFEQFSSVIKLIKSSWKLDSIIQNAPCFSFDKELVLLSMKRNALNLQWASEKLRNDPLVVRYAVSLEGAALRYASRDLRGDRETVLIALREMGMALQYATHELRSDRELVIAAVRMHPKALRYASRDLLSDPDVLLAAGSSVFGEYLPQMLSESRKFIRLAISRNINALPHASLQLRADRELAHESVRQFGPSLRFLSAELRDDESIVRTALRNDPCSLIYASDRLRGHKGIVAQAVKQYPSAFEYASDSLRSDASFVLGMLKIDPFVFEYACPSLSANREFVKIAMKECGARVLLNANDALKDEYELIHLALSLDGKFLLRLLPDMRTNRHLALVAVKQNVEAYRLVPDSLKVDREIVEHVLRHDGMLLWLCPKSVQDDESLVRIAIEQNMEALQFASVECQSRILGSRLNGRKDHRDGYTGGSILKTPPNIIRGGF
mmetsp:Transcript_4610/g.17401  ORF Transcript_4610/g.17401 Transcript_4610/m.17401 type:complete len:585 (-) Transcript_4610:147-1901(-)|eukprot:CAMPEP_0117437278 /NCGR_PEP_ID=MMETSP0759-20121206/1441_1 /TAXON_ID=63605 /ORGANISM="Percolomonas cosmopolitus, Strain WS" /LENGTH=584 /DNA_ID=CAMNT_0005228905 /DNA_START=100 /DNA_END=1854 /DNA_ORIENTATION=-